MRILGIVQAFPSGVELLTRNRLFAKVNRLHSVGLVCAISGVASECEAVTASRHCCAENGLCFEAKSSKSCCAATSSEGTIEQGTFAVGSKGVQVCKLESL
jgi:hypothetical protein